MKQKKQVGNSDYDIIKKVECPSCKQKLIFLPTGFACPQCGDQFELRKIEVSTYTIIPLSVYTVQILNPSLIATITIS